MGLSLKAFHGQGLSHEPFSEAIYYDGTSRKLLHQDLEYQLPAHHRGNGTCNAVMIPRQPEEDNSQK